MTHYFICRLLKFQEVDNYNSLKDQTTGSVCRGNGRVMFIRNDFLTVKEEGWKTVEGAGRTDSASNSEWKSSVSDVDYLVISTGHHNNMGQGISEEIHMTLLNRLVEYLASNTPSKLQIMYLTTSLAHPFCSKYAQPVTIQLDNETQYQQLLQDWLESIPTELNSYNWQTFPRYNDLMMEKMRLLNATIVDIAPSTLLRPDGHR